MQRAVLKQSVNSLHCSYTSCDSVEDTPNLEAFLGNRAGRGGQDASGASSALAAGLGRIEHEILHVRCTYYLGADLGCAM